MVQQLNILIVDDHKMIREGLLAMLQLYQKDWKFNIDLADSGENAIKKCDERLYDLIIMDYQLPGISGFQATESILKKYPTQKIIALSNYDEFSTIKEMLDAGVQGFILKNISSDELIKAIRTVLKGRQYFSNEVAIQLLEYNQSNQKKTSEAEDIMSCLSEREIEILKLISLEKTNQEIAEILYLSKRTIDKHRQHLLEKFNTNNTVGLIKRALELKII